MWQIINNQKKKKKQEKKEKRQRKIKKIKKPAYKKDIEYATHYMIYLQSYCVASLWNGVLYRVNKGIWVCNISNRVSCSPWSSPRYSEVVEASAKGNIYFL